MEVSPKKTNFLINDKDNPQRLTSLEGGEIVEIPGVLRPSVSAYKFAVTKEYTYLGTPISYNLEETAIREFQNFATKKKNWKGLAIEGAHQKENTMFRMYVTSKIKHRILPYLLNMALNKQ